MICTGRKFAEMGRKLIPRRALAQQEIRADDSVFKERHESGKGLKKTYGKLIKEAFKEHFWKTDELFDGFT